MTTPAAISDDDVFDVVEPTPAPAKRAKAKPAPEVIESEPEVASAAEVATVADNAPALHTVELDAGWEYDRLDFKGDRLAIRKPLRQTGVALHFASSEYAPAGVADKLSGLLIARILGPESYVRVMWRMMDPDDPDYVVTTVTELVGEVMKVAAEGWGNEAAAAE